MNADDAPLLAHRRWAEAVVGRDVETIEALMGPGLRYVHSTGIVHDRAGYIEFVRAGPRFLSVAMDTIELRRFADIALMTGTLRLALRRGDELDVRHVASLATQVWRLDHQGRWRLELAQTTSLPSTPEPAR